MSKIHSTDYPGLIRFCKFDGVGISLNFEHRISQVVVAVEEELFGKLHKLYYRIDINLA